jgi:hypothetical protein
MLSGQQTFIFTFSEEKSSAVGNLLSSRLPLGGGPTDDKPTISLHTPKNPNEFSSFMNIRVTDIQASYEEWRKKGAEFLTEPKNHALEIRCYMRDPDGYIIEIGQTTGGLKDIKD